MKDYEKETNFNHEKRLIEQEIKELTKEKEIFMSFEDKLEKLPTKNYTSNPNNSTCAKNLRNTVDIGVIKKCI